MRNQVKEIVKVLKENPNYYLLYVDNNNWGIWKNYEAYLSNCEDTELDKALIEFWNDETDTPKEEGINYDIILALVEVSHGLVDIGA
jgi:hypothetical protein